MIKIVYSCLFLFLLSNSSFAQSYRVTGTITFYDGQNVFDPTIKVEGEEHFIRWDYDGSFYIDFYGSKEAVIEISYQNYPVQEFKVSKKEHLEVVIDNRCEGYGLMTLLLILYPYNTFTSLGDYAYKKTNLDQALYYNNGNLNQELHLLTGLNEAPGLKVFKEGLNSNSVRIRGVSSQKVSIDQVQIYTGENENLLEDLEASMFRVAKIQKGANLTSGMQQGGHLSFNSEFDRPLFSTMFGTGADGYFKTSNTLKLIQEYDGCFSRHLSVNHSLVQGDGHRENSAYKKHSITINGKTGGPEINENPFRLFLHYAAVEKGLVGPLDLNDFENNPESAHPAWKAIGAFDEHQTAMLGMSKKWTLWEDEQNRDEKLYSNNSVFGIWNDAKRLNPSFLLDTDMLVWGGKSNLEYTQSPSINWDYNLYAGLEYYGELINWEHFAPENVIASELVDRNQERRNYFDLHVGTEHHFKEKFHVNTGFNINKSLIQTVDKFDGDAINYSQWKSARLVFSPQLEASYNIDEHANQFDKIVWKIAHGFTRLPTGSIAMAERRFQYFAEAERSWNYELGISGIKSPFGRGLNDIYYMATVYWINRKNLWSADSLNIGQAYHDDGRATHRGFELFIKGIGKYVEWYTAYNYATARFDDFKEHGENRKSLSLPGFSPHTLNTGLLIKSEYQKNVYRWFYARFNYEYTSAMQIRNDNAIATQPYHRLDAKVGFQFQLGHNSYYHIKGTKLSVKQILRYFPKELRVNVHVGINNILDQRYASGFANANDLQSGFDAAYFYPGVPRYFYVGVKIEKPEWP